MWLGIDPGASGGIAALNRVHELRTWKMPETERDISDIFEEIAPGVVIAIIESVHSLPRQGVSSTFAFGRNYGFLRGMLIAHKIAFEEVTPGTWQRALHCLSKGDKNVTKSMAQQLFPQHKMTHAIADAALIAEYNFRMYKGMVDGIAS